MRNWQRWLPGGLLVGGCLLNGVLLARRVDGMPLRAPVASVATTSMGARGVDHPIDDDQRRVAGMTTFMFRDYRLTASDSFSIYVGYYDEQRQGKSIHSPKNCLPGSGWEPVEQGPFTVAAASGPVTINRYRVVNGAKTAIVYYWYQGRGRVAHDEMRVKYELLRDAALYGRTEEALVRIVIPVSATLDIPGADKLAAQIAAPLVADVDRVLPTL